VKGLLAESSSRYFLERRLRSADDVEVQDVTASELVGAWGFDLQGMDGRLTAGQDWYQYIAGTWLSTTEIPADRTKWTAFAQVAKLTQTQLKQLLEEGASAGTKTGDFYASYMDVDERELRGVTPILPTVELIRDISSGSQLAHFLGATQYEFGSSLFSLDIGADDRDPYMNVANLGLSGLGMPSRDYYLEDAYADKKQAYQKMVGDLLAVVGWPEPSTAAEKVIAFETELAKVTWDQARLRDPEKTYNKMQVRELSTEAPGFDWSAFMRGAGGITDDATLIVSAWDKSAEDGVIGAAKLLESADLSAVKAWAAAQVLKGCGSYLNKAAFDVKFAYSQALTGQEQPKERWELAVSATSSFMSDAVGQAYVERFFPASAKESAVELTLLLKEAFKRRIEKVAWMSETTKAAALRKLEAFTFDVGYPEKWIDYSSLKVDKKDLYGNLVRALALKWQFDLDQLGKPVDRAYWGMAPQTVNAYFDFTRNGCVFLAAILQPPFFSPNGDMAVNLGGIGGVIGHEMTHGFDDSGSRYDETGTLNDWWSTEDRAEFSQRAEAYGQQFATFTNDLPPGMHIRPELTMGENLADLGGVNIAYDALEMWLENHDYNPTPPMLRDDGDVAKEAKRRFFAGWGQVWRTKIRPGALQSQLLSDPHSPGVARATIPVQNVDGWYEAYDVEEGDHMYIAPEQRAVIW